MNKKGFTLIELLAVLALLGIIVAITVYSISSIFKNAKEKSEEAFVATLSDAAEMYLTGSEVKNLSYTKCSNTLNKKHNSSVSVYKMDTSINKVTFRKIMDSEYKPLTDKDFVNPANKEASCNVNASVTIYRDEDYVYYYSFDKEALECLTKKDGIVTNLPKGFSC